MFELNIRFQMAAIWILLMIIIDYIKSPHLRLSSSKFFKALLCATLLNLVLDAGTVYTITHLDTVSPEINRIFHQLFIGSVILVIFFEYLYIRMLANNQKRMGIKELMWTLVPMAVSILVVAFGKLYYVVDEPSHTAYSIGPMAYAVYICATVYLAAEIKLVFLKKGTLNRNHKISIFLSLGIWIGVLLVQSTHPRFLISGFGFSLLVLVIYFAYENQKENIELEIGCFNRNAFNKMLAEYYSKKRPVYLINLTCRNLDRINKIAGRNASVQAMKSLKTVFEKQTGKQVYRSRDEVLSIFVNRKLEKMMEKLHSLELALQEEDFSTFKLDCHISVMDLRKYTKSQDEVDDLLDFICNRMQHSDCSICFLNDEILKGKQRRDKLDVLLDQALNNDGFEMYYQPIYNSETGTFTSAEALIRLKDYGDLGYVSPEEFIPMAEEKGLILDIGDRTLELVADFVMKNDLIHSQLEYIEVNLSAIQAVVPKLDQRLHHIIQKYQLPPSFINLEITETATVNFGSTFTNNINHLRSLGFSFSMDDFGTGYSNLAQMNQIRYDLVKLDKSLIWPAFEENENAAQAERLLSSVISLLQHVDIKIVAEGVETEAMTNYLIDKGVEHLQGYYFSRPIPGNSFVAFLKAKEALQQ